MNTPVDMLLTFKGLLVDGCGSERAVGVSPGIPCVSPKRGSTSALPKEPPASRSRLAESLLARSLLSVFFKAAFFLPESELFVLDGAFGLSSGEQSLGLSAEESPRSSLARRFCFDRLWPSARPLQFPASAGATASITSALVVSIINELLIFPCL